MHNFSMKSNSLVFKTSLKWVICIIILFGLFSCTVERYPYKKKKNRKCNCPDWTLKPNQHTIHKPTVHFENI